MADNRNWKLCGAIPGRDRIGKPGKPAALVCASREALDILPLRYSVIPAKAAKSLPGFPSTLGEGVTDVRLEQSAYAPRFLVAGYLYILLSRQGRKQWMAYAATPKGYLFRFDPSLPGSALGGVDDDDQPVQLRLPKSDSGLLDVQASLITIPNPASTEKAYFLFAPLPILTDKLDEYSANADSLVAAGKMQIFRPKDWVNGTVKQPHTLTAQDLGKHVPEYLAREEGVQAHPELALALASAGLPTFEDAFESNRLADLKKQMDESSGAVFVLRDPIGITQELNDYRNAPMAAFERYLEVPDAHGVTPKHRLQIHESLVEARSAYVKGVMRERGAGIDAYYEYAEKRRQRRADFAAAGPWGPSSEDLAAEEERIEAAHQQAIIREKANSELDWTEKYESRLDVDEMRRFKLVIDKRLDEVNRIAKTRAPDHLAWFQSQQFIDAFDVFGQSNVECYNFAYCSAASSVGITGTRLGEDRVSEWTTAMKVERDNIFMRGFLFNRKELLAEVHEAFPVIAKAVEGVAHASDLPPALVLKACKGLVSGFAAMDGAFDEWVRFLRDKKSPLDKVKVASSWGKTAEASLLFHKVSEITRTIFRAGVGGRFDKTITACLGALLHSRLGDITKEFSFKEAFIPIPADVLANCKTRNAQRRALQSNRDKAARVAQLDAEKAEESLQKLIEDARVKAQSKVKAGMADLSNPNKPAAINNYHQVRIGLLLSCIEAVALGEKLVHFDGSGKAALDIFGSVFSLLGTGCNMVYNGVKSVREIAPYAGIKAISDAGDVVRGGWKLAAGAMSTAASVIAAAMDGWKAGETWGKDKVLATLYAVRAAAGALNAMFSAFVAASYALPWLTWKAAQRPLIRGGEYVLERVVRWRCLVWAARFNWIGLAMTLAEIGYVLLRDDELEKWTDRCVFRRKKTGSGHGSTSGFRTWKEELAELEKAVFAAVVEG
jgi:hypothetical protein